MDLVEEECQARRAKERAQQYVVPALLQNISPTSVQNKDRGKKRKRFYLAPVHVLQNLKDAILDLHRYQLAEQQQRTTKEYRIQITRVEAERQRQENVVQRNHMICHRRESRRNMGMRSERWRLLGRNLLMSLSTALGQSPYIKWYLVLLLPLSLFKTGAAGC